MKKFIDILRLLGVDKLLLGLLERLLSGMLKKVEDFKQKLCTILQRLATIRQA